MSALRLILATAILHLVLVQPNHPEAMTWGALWAFPLELPAIVLAVMALGRGRVGLFVRAVLTALLTVIAVLKGADFVSFNTLSRGFNPVADFPLVAALFRFLSGTLGGLLAAGAFVVVVLCVAMLARALWWAMGVWARIGVGPLWARGAGVAALVAMAVVVAEVGDTMDVWNAPARMPGTAFTARVGVERVVTVRQTLAELRAFREEVANDPYAGASGLFEIIDRDVLILFVESYGRTSFDTPYYAEVHGETLAAYDAILRERGLSMRSGFLTSPTHGGQSWLAHSTVSNGMWINNQVRYGAALTSERETLFHYASNAGLRTAAVMPAITLDWPEASGMGFETILNADDLGYAGLPFNWVTMPDQYTLSMMDRLLRQRGETRHLFAQIALISSHAPWVPVPDLIAWDDIGDGAVFNEVASSGDTPEVVWRDRERVRFQYRLAVDYALQAVFDYARIHAENPPLMIVIGDHQAASFIGLDDRREVPVHVIGPAHLVSALAQIAPSEGLVPDAGSPALAMDEVRDIVLSAFQVDVHSGPAE
ncbi:sulfatase-like hydrolase/transferase [Gymnodinialimonas sp. 57CJ19]|uniref:sulfatase-like hydrolase/transferase n=1 Tax=Gymnodinialimonas sp. 57CJ19 TaxID=3138498 RepID=UPI00313458B1